MTLKIVFFVVALFLAHSPAIGRDTVCKSAFDDTFFVAANHNNLRYLRGTDTLKIQFLPSINHGIDTSLFVGALAIIVSFVSVVISYLTYKIQRKHNINSLRPVLTIIQSDYQKRVQVELKNQGTGVAIIVGWYVRKGIDSRLSIIEWLPKRLPHGLTYEDYYIGNEFCALCANETLNFFEMRFEKTRPEHVQTRVEIRNILKDLSVEIHYKDIYDNEYVCKSDLNFYTRVDEEDATLAVDEVTRTE